MDERGPEAVMEMWLKNLDERTERLTVQMYGLGLALAAILLVVVMLSTRPGRKEKPRDDLR